MVSRTPLRVLPLDRFLHSDNSQQASRPNHLKHSTKRPRSPSAMLSPAKRRILREEGFLPPPPFQLKRSVEYERPSMGTAYFRSRNEDLGSPMHIDSDSSRCVEGSPLTDAVAYRTRSKTSPPKGTGPTKTRSTTSKSSSNRPPPSATPPTRSAPPLMIPREMPARPDPQSVHYPGFDIHYDTHIELPSTSSRYIPEPDLERDKEGRKENLPPRRISKKPSMPFEVGSAGLTGGKPFVRPRVDSLPATPFRATPLRSSVTPFTGRGAFKSSKIGRAHV